MRLGYKLMSEELGPRELVANAVRAEELGFQLAAISDHYFPWLEEEGHAPFIWSVLGAIATATERIELMTAVTCPTLRYHPAVVAQAAATVSVMAGRRFRLGLGSGEQLNEHVIGGGWPAPAVRQQRLEEAIDVIRLLFSGETCSHRGEYFELDRARIFDLPDEPPPIVVAAGGPRAARIAGEKADGLIATEPRRDLVDAYRGGGGQGARCVEIGLCWAEKADAALDTMHRYARWTKLDWSVLPELATPRAFDAASQSVKRSDLREIPHGPDLETYVDAIEPYLEAGFDELILHQIGPEQDGFLQFFASELGPALRARGEARAAASSSSSPSPSPRRHS
jgi:G6PDH family F420-dependent oxidoreductase